MFTRRMEIEEERAEIVKENARKNGSPSGVPAITSFPKKEKKA